VLVPFVPFGECADHRLQRYSGAAAQFTGCPKCQLSSIHVPAVQAVRCHCLRCTGCIRTRRPRMMQLIAAVHAPGCSGYTQTVTCALSAQHYLWRSA
jgi:hypothetical protein